MELTRRHLLKAGAALGAGVVLPIGAPWLPTPASATETDPYVGEIGIVAFDFPPRGWTFCNGQTLSIAQNIVLFSLLGTTFGGDGRTTFRLPDLRGRSPLCAGQGGGLSSYVIGQTGGVEHVTLVMDQLARHRHVMAAGGTADAQDPAGRLWAAGVNTPYATSGNQQGALAKATVQPVGGGQAHDNMPPFLVLNFVIALQGVFPS